MTSTRAAVQQGLEIACLLCQSLPKIGLFHWCGPVCRQKAESGAPMLIELPKSDPKFADIVNQFTKSWSPLKGAVPAVHKIFKCMNTKAAEDRFQQYRQNVEADGAFVAQGKTAGNENRRWHGTIRRCKIGDTSINLTPCSSATCFVCCIIKTGFDINYAAKGWYGTGLYCSSHSSTSNGYTKGAAPGSPYRAMFLNRVIVGTEYVWGKTKGKDLIAKALVSPPDGYDSRKQEIEAAAGGQMYIKEAKGRTNVVLSPISPICRLARRTHVLHVISTAFSAKSHPSISLVQVDWTSEMRSPGPSDASYSRTILAILLFADTDRLVRMNMFRKKDTKLCKHCGLQPCFGNFDYCSKTCGQAAKANSSAPGPANGGYGRPAAQPPYNGGGGYGNYRNPRGGYGDDDDDDFGDDDRASAASNMCKVCRVRPVHKNFEFCSKACSRFAASGHARQASDPRGGYGQGSARRRPSAPDDEDEDEDEDGDEDDTYDAGSSPGAVVPFRRNALCMNCHQYPKVKGRDFCSKACLNAAASRLAAAAQQNDTSNIQFSGVAVPNFGNGRPPFPAGNPGGFAPIVYQGTGYGGQAYPQNWQQQQGAWAQGGYGQQQPAPAAGPAPPPQPVGKPCKIMNCTGREFQPGAKYCSHKCRKAAVQQGLEVACLMCKEMPKAPKRHFCGKACSDKAEKGAPILLDVPKSDPKFADIVKQFNDTWQGGSQPTVHRICKVVNSKAVEDRFQAYRQKVETAGNWVSKGKTAGNENRRWHGTVRECTVGDDPNNLDMCTSTSCRLCCVIRTSFDMKYVAVGIYGLGIYTSAFSSTSHGYTRVATKGSPYRAMFLTRIITGKEHIFVSGTTDPNAKAPPAGHDSVAVCAKHSALIVFQNEAICPSWLVLYS
ncbi:hypothetical protein FRB90_007798 [Tulasnella sp. 427]|nr:hypothetical protein FRB90_007798 [Tulasnella sp. 427]